MCYDHKPPTPREPIVVAAELARAGNTEAAVIIRDQHDELRRLRAENERLKRISWESYRLAGAVLEVLDAHLGFGEVMMFTEKAASAFRFVYSWRFKAGGELFEVRRYVDPIVVSSVVSVEAFAKVMAEAMRGDARKVTGEPLH